MNIDVFHGNPPYQNIDKRSKLRGSSDSLWKQAVKVAQSNGPEMISFITPTNMFSGSERDTREIVQDQGDMIVGGQYSIASVDFDTDDEFEDEFGNSCSVGVNTCRWMMLKNNNSDNIQVNGNNYKLSKLQYIHRDKEVMNLLNRIMSIFPELARLQFSSSRGYSGPTNFTTEQTDTHLYPIDVNGKLKYASKINSQIGRHLIIAPRISVVAPYYASDRMTEGSSYTMESFTKEEAESLMKLLNTKLYRFVFNVTKVGGRLARTYMNKLPLLDLSKEWNDENVMKLFNITKAEEKVLSKNLTLNKSKKGRSKKSKLRLDKTGEVFTSINAINRMFENYPERFWQSNIVFCDPTCGNGNFVVETIRRKIMKGHSKINALETTLGVDIMQDNIDECKSRVLNLVGDEEKYRAIVNKNIVCADALFGFDFENFVPFPSKENLKENDDDYLSSIGINLSN
jgi:hypothetical protein